MFTRVSQKLVPALVDRSRSTPLTAMMSSLSVSSQPKHVALRSPHNMFCHGYSRLSFDFPSAASVFRGSSSFQPELMSSRGFTEARLAKSLISDASTPIIKPNGLLQARGFASKKHKRVIKQSKGFRGRANRCYRVAIRRLEKSWQYAYRDRKVKKREFRKLWIMRLNAGVRQQGLSYSNFIAMQNKSGITLDRKILSNLAMYEPFSFKAVVDVVKKSSVSARMWRNWSFLAQYCCCFNSWGGGTILIFLWTFSRQLEGVKYHFTFHLMAKILGLNVNDVKTKLGSPRTIYWVRASAFSWISCKSTLATA